MKGLIFKCFWINSNFKLAVLRKNFTLFLGGHFIKRLARVFRSYCELSRNEDLLFFPFHGYHLLCLSQLYKEKLLFLRIYFYSF